MKKELRFNIPFSGFSGTTFINCFTSAYMYFEKIDVGGYDYDCVQREGKSCNSCGKCAKGGQTPISLQEKYFFLFDTMCGRSSLRCRFDNEMTEMQKMINENTFYDSGSENNIEFIFGFAGYKYSKICERGGFRDAVTDSVNSGRPLLAKVSSGSNRFRVITGYDGDALLCPDYTNAQQRPAAAPVYDEIESLYIFGEKTEPKYKLIDGLKRIQSIMEYNIRENLWGGYTEKIGLYTSDSFSRANIDEKKARMKRVAATMWHTFNCHNFAEVFRNYRKGGNPAVYDNIGDMKKPRDPSLLPYLDKISGPCCGYTHDLAWSLIGLEQCADFTKHAAGYFGEMVELTLSQIAKNDEEALSAVKAIISVIEKIH